MSWLDSVDPNPAKKGLKYWCQDETRIGLKTIERKKITARGVKPIGLVQWNFKAYYLYGAVAPQTGENFWLEFSHLDGQCFQIFLDNLAAEYPEHLNVVQLDNGQGKRISKSIDNRVLRHHHVEINNQREQSAYSYYP